MPVINTNLNALSAQNALGSANALQAKSMQRLSTGLRINSAADDAAGLAISNRMTSQVNGFAVAIRNSNDGISMAQTAEGGMSQITTMLQRIRDLAVQSATGTMTASDRTNSQQEVDQLKTQIQDIAVKTNLNGINLLDGSAGKVQLQTGTNAGDTMNIGFDSMQTKDIGLGSRASLSSVGGMIDTASTTGANNALQDGSIILNGVSVGASLSTSDSLSSVDNSSSAIAKAAAINAVSAQSGVFATVGKTEVAGTSGMNATAGQTAVLKINGVTTATIEFTNNNELNRAAIAQAINQISAQTGVTATNSHDDQQGISLTAADGRNVDLQTGDANAITGLGLSAAGTYVGSYELNTKDGTSISVSSTVARVEDGQQTSGLSFGSYKPDVAQMVTTTRATANGTASPTSADAGQLLGNTLMINGVGITAANGNDDTSSSGTTAQKAGSAISIAAAINKSTSLTGVSATAQANVISGTGFTAGAVTSVTLNGVTISTNLGTSSTREDVLNELNAYSGQTGVVATDSGSGIALTAADGRNITIATDGAAAALGLDGTSVSSTSTTFYGKVSLTSDKAYTLTSGSEGPESNFTKLGFAQGTYGGADNGVKVAQIDITSTQGATDAIKAVDAAINTVSENQARAGAFQNRLNYIVNNLTNENQNISASRSRIQDADYGTETTNMAKAQIVQQAATAMLAQANQSQQTVLSLLK